MKLAFGAAWMVPETVDTAWGARWIFPNDMLWDRQANDGPDWAQLQQWLNSGPLKSAREAAARAAKRYEITQESYEQVILYRDAAGVIVGTPNASYGYLYVVAWLHNNDPAKQAPFKCVGENKRTDARADLRNRSSRINASIRRSRSAK